jgi:hypothetical protein
LADAIAIACLLESAGYLDAWNAHDLDTLGQRLADSQHGAA